MACQSSERDVSAQVDRKSYLFCLHKIKQSSIIPRMKKRWYKNPFKLTFLGLLVTGVVAGSYYVSTHGSGAAGRAEQAGESGFAAAEPLSSMPSTIMPGLILPGCVWNATPRSLSPLERNIGFWTQA